MLCISYIKLLINYSSVYIVLYTVHRPVFQMNIYTKSNILFGVTYSIDCIGANTCICNQQEILIRGASLAHVKFHVLIVNISSNIRVTSHGLYVISFHRLRDRLFKILSRLITNRTFRALHYWPLLLATGDFTAQRTSNVEKLFMLSSCHLKRNRPTAYVPVAT